MKVRQRKKRRSRETSISDIRHACFYYKNMHQILTPVQMHRLKWICQVWATKIQQLTHDRAATMRYMKPETKRKLLFESVKIIDIITNQKQW